MKKVLLLSASYGEGHNAAARGLLAALQERGGAEAELYDPFPEALGALYDRSRRDYLAMIERRPRLWAFVYTLLHRTPLIYFTLPGLWTVKRALRRKVKEFQPEVIVSVYPVYSFLLNALFPRRSFRFLTIVTDSITINSVWHRSACDVWLVPNEASAEVMRAAGVPSDRLRVLGFPVPPVFARNPETRRPPSAGEPLRVLYMINADKAAAPGLVEQLLTVDGIALTVTVGRDDALRAAVEAAVQRSGKTVEIHGWTPNMPELLMAHHVLIGKAGGAAVQETIAARTPMLITKAVPGQEEGNARLLVEAGAGELCETPARLVATLRRLVADDAREWGTWEANITKLSRPDAALQIADEVLGA